MNIMHRKGTYSVLLDDIISTILKEELVSEEPATAKNRVCDPTPRVVLLEKLIRIRLCYRE